MNVRKCFSSLVPTSSLLFIGLALLSMGTTNCGTDQACFYFTQVEFDLDNSCPSRQEALRFFQGEFCATPIVSVDSDGRFDGDTCCYDITESNDFFGCAGPIDLGPPFPGVTTVATGVGGMGGFGGAGGMGGSGGSCARCTEFLTTTNPPTLCDTSIPVYEAYTDCKCFGACAMPCADTCANNTPSTTCEDCLTDFANGCGSQFQACLDDM